MQRKNNISSEHAIKFINSLNANILPISKNEKFYIHISKNESEYPYAYIYYKKIENATKMVNWLKDHGIDAIAKYIENKTHFLVKIPHVNAFPQDFFDVGKLDEQQTQLIRAIKSDNHNLQLFNDFHLKKLMETAIHSFSVINKGLEITNNDTNELSLVKNNKFIELGLTDYLLAHSDNLKKHNCLLIEYFHNISNNLMIFENALLSNTESVLSYFILTSNVAVSALEATLDKMISYGVYAMQHVKAVNANNEIASLLTRNHLHTENEKLHNIIIKLKQISEACININNQLSLLGDHCLYTKMFFVYKLNLLNGEQEKSVEDEEIFFENIKTECNEQFNQMNSLLKDLKDEVNLLSNQAEEKNYCEIKIESKLSTTPVFFATPHEVLLRQIDKIIPNNKRDLYPYFLNAINEKNYAKALRTACTSESETAFRLIKLLLLYKGILKIDVNEQAGSRKYAALHHVALHGNKEIYDYLVSQGAAQLEDDDGNTPEQLLPKQGKSLGL